MNKTALKVLTTVVLAILTVSMLGALHFAAAQPNPADTISVVNPGPASYPSRWTAGPASTVGTSNFIFNTGTGTGLYNTFFVNITAGPNVSNLFGWGFGLMYDNATLQYVNTWLPVDNVFAGALLNGVSSLTTPGVVIAPINSTCQEVQWGCSYVMPTPSWDFNGTGTLAQIEFNITQAPTILNSVVSADFQFDAAWTAFYFWPSGSEVPKLGTGYFEFDWIAPTMYPYFYVTPSTYTAITPGEFFNISVGVNNVSAPWSIIGFQFSLWFNQTIIAPVTYWNGSWIDTFCTNGETSIAVATDDYLWPTDLLLPGPGYNMWFAFQAIVPGTGGLWYAPFPSTTTGGILFTFEFQAVLSTIFPATLSTALTLNDMEVYNAYDMPIPVLSPVNGMYTAPVKVIGRSIDLYDQYPAPYGGQGIGFPSDAFAPQALVDLFANVTYNLFPVQQKPVAFEVIPPATATAFTSPIYLSAFSDQNGVAMVSFRIPWPCVDPEQVLGIWTVYATTEIAQGQVQDVMQFEVQFPVSIISIVSNDTYTQSKYNLPEPAMKFTVTYETYQMQTGFQSTTPPPGPNANLPPYYGQTVYYNSTVLETVDAYDNLGFFIGMDFIWKLIPVTSTWNVPNVWTDTFVIVLITNAVVGQATAYADAFSQYPQFGGVPYCPEAYTTFEIIAPP
jgi:hypothetical protein